MKETHKERLQRELKNPPEEDPEFQIAPMIDILLVLLVFFMSISSTEVLQANREITLPVATDAKNSKDNPGQIIINITWVPLNNAGSLEVDTVKYPNPVDLVPRLQKAINANPLTRVLIRADKSVRYDYLRSVLKAVGDAGVTNVTFSVVDKEAPQRQAQL
jgi:biopolymer transport protein ExbD